MLSLQKLAKMDKPRARISARIAYLTGLYTTIELRHRSEAEQLAAHASLESDILKARRMLDRFPQ